MMAGIQKRFELIDDLSKSHDEIFLAAMNRIYDRMSAFTPYPNR